MVPTVLFTSRGPKNIVRDNVPLRTAQVTWQYHRHIVKKSNSIFACCSRRRSLLPPIILPPRQATPQVRVSKISPGRRRLQSQPRKTTSRTLDTLLANENRCEKWPAKHRRGGVRARPKPPERSNQGPWGAGGGTCRRLCNLQP